jgi:hypothetical protein
MRTESAVMRALTRAIAAGVSCADAAAARLLRSRTGPAEAGDAAAARDQYAALLPVFERVFGAEHPDALTARANLAAWIGQAGNPAGARSQFAALLPVMKKILGLMHSDTIAARNSVAYWSTAASRRPPTRRNRRAR